MRIKGEKGAEEADVLVERIKRRRRLYPARQRAERKSKGSEKEREGRTKRQRQLTLHKEKQKGKENPKRFYAEWASLIQGPKKRGVSGEKTRID